MTDRQFSYRIDLISCFWDENEKMHETCHGTRKHIGTDETAIAMARRTRTEATEARISRTGVVGHGPYVLPRDAGCVRAFTISLD